jgi:hypothetical protein
MKKLLVLSGIVASLVLPQTAKAGSCEYGAFYAFAMIVTVTSAPTGTTMLTTDSCREEVLAVREDAQQFQITGEETPLLKSIFKDAKAIQPEMSNEDFAANIIAGSSAL